MSREPVPLAFELSASNLDQHPGDFAGYFVPELTPTRSAVHLWLCIPPSKKGPLPDGRGSESSLQCPDTGFSRAIETGFLSGLSRWGRSEESRERKTPHSCFPQP